MKRFARLFAELDSTDKSDERVEQLKQYFTSAAEDLDKMYALALLLGKRQRRYVNTAQLRAWATESAELPEWLFEESYTHVGDLAETVALIVPAQGTNADTGLAQWMQELAALKELEESERRGRILAAWQSLPREQIFVFNKLVTGGFRAGVSRKLVTRAIAEAFDLEKGVVAHRLMGNWQAGDLSFTDLTAREDKLADISRPYPFYLAHPLDDEPDNLGPREQWQAEWKWDGIRAQIVKRAGELFVWSRGEELISDAFPEFNALRDSSAADVVLDGEILVVIDGRIQPFHALQRRIGRKTVGKKLLNEAPAALLACDLLELDGVDMRGEALHKRRAALETYVDALKLDVVGLVPPLTAASWADLGELRRRAREYRAEGLMLKHRDSLYLEGRKRGDWWKWKIDPLTIDAVMIYAQRDQSSRAETYSDYTFAVWDDEGNLAPLAKVSSDLSESEKSDIAQFIKHNTLERFGPVRTVKAELVFEIAFEGIQESKRHKSGVALRFPRIHRRRPDKTPAEVDTLANVKQLLQTVNGVFDD